MFELIFAVDNHALNDPKRPLIGQFAALRGQMEKDIMIRGPIREALRSLAAGLSTGRHRDPFFGV